MTILASLSEPQSATADQFSLTWTYSNRLERLSPAASATAALSFGSSTVRSRSPISFA